MDSTNPCLRSARTEVWEVPRVPAWKPVDGRICGAEPAERKAGIVARFWYAMTASRAAKAGMAKAGRSQINQLDFLIAGFGAGPDGDGEASTRPGSSALAAVMNAAPARRSMEHSGQSKACSSNDSRNS